MSTTRDAIAKAVEALNLSRAQWKAMCREDMVDVIDEATDALRALPEQTASEDVKPVVGNMYDKAKEWFSEWPNHDIASMMAAFATRVLSQPLTPPSSDLVEAAVTVEQVMEVVNTMPFNWDTGGAYVYIDDLCTRLTTLFNPK